MHNFMQGLLGVCFVLRLLSRVSVTGSCIDRAEYESRPRDRATHQCVHQSSCQWGERPKVFKSKTLETLQPTK